MHGKWHNIELEGLPKEKGYYLVALERTNWAEKSKYYDTSFIFFRGKTTWATCNRNIKAWMELPTDYGIENSDLNFTEWDMDTILEQLEDYGIHNGILLNLGGYKENFIPVSVAKQIVKSKGLNGILGYMEEDTV